MDKIQFYSSLRSMLKLTEEKLLVDIAPLNDPHNTGSRILRHGLSVTAFALLERYLQHEFDALMDEIPKSKISFSSFSDELREMIVSHAVAGLNTRAIFLEKSRRQAFFESGIQKIGQFSAIPPVYTAYGFSPRGSNVGHEDIKQAFRSFGVSDCWGRMSNLAKDLGLSRVNLQNDFQNLALTRHASAHNPSGNVPTSDLITNIETAIIVGVTIALLCSSIKTSFLQAKNKIDLETRVSEPKPQYRVVDELSDGSWLERRFPTGAGVKKFSSEEEAINSIKIRKTANQAVFRNKSLIPLALY